MAHQQAISLLSCACQGDPISAYLFILVMEILFIQIRSDKNIQGLKIFGQEFKLSAFAYVSCFLYSLHSVEQLLKLLQISQEFTSLKVNYDRSEMWYRLKEKGYQGILTVVTNRHVK